MKLIDKITNDQKDMALVIETLKYNISDFPWFCLRLYGKY